MGRDVLQDAQDLGTHDNLLNSDLDAVYARSAEARSMGLFGLLSS